MTQTNIQDIKQQTRTRTYSGAVLIESQECSNRTRAFTFERI